jgi:hypothetical protein
MQNYELECAQKKISADLDIENLIKQNRTLKAALRVLMTENQTKLCSEQLEFTTIPHLHDWLQNEEAHPDEPTFQVESEIDRILVYGLSNRKIAACRGKISNEAHVSMDSGKIFLLIINF